MEICYAFRINLKREFNEMELSVTQIEW
jgi:hypothetical protein